MIYSFTLSPKYQIVADVKLKEESGNTSLQGGSSVLSFITGGGAGNSYWDFYNIVYSTEVAESFGLKVMIQKSFPQITIQKLKNTEDYLQLGKKLNHG